MKYTWDLNIEKIPVSRPARALWIEIHQIKFTEDPEKSRPARALWIEMVDSGDQTDMVYVEAREGLVD